MNSEFKTNLEKLFKKIGTHAVMTLATGSENRVTARPVSVVVVNGKFYFQTNKNYLKYKQISENPKSALCFNNYSIEGQCTFIGKPLDTENAVFAKIFKKHFYMAYSLYSHIEDEALAEFTPTLIYCWGYKLNKPYMEYWDFINESYHLEYK